MFDSPSKPATSEYRENWDRIWGVKKRSDGALILMEGGDLSSFAGHSIVLDPAIARDEVRLLTAYGVYRITNIGEAQ